MVDIENDVYDLVSSELTANIKDILVLSDYINIPKKFPCVFIYETDNYIDEETSTSSEIENHAVVMFTVEVYSNSKTGKKSECKKIIEIVDRVLGGIGFIRVMKTPIPNQFDASVYRITARYRATVSKNNEIYRR